MKTVFNLNDIRALVTGSTRGIGCGIADYLDRCGAQVLRHGRAGADEPGGPESTDPANYLAADLMAEGGAEELVERAFQRQPELNTLISNAGGFFDQSFHETRRSDFAKTMRLNLEATFVICRDFAKKLIEQNRTGTIVIISSTNGFQAETDSVAYDTSKGGLVTMTKSFAASLAPHGIRVNGVAPGLIQTPLTEGTLLGSPDIVAHYERKILLQRIGQPEDCAGACAFLISEAAGYITGHTVVVDGGLTTTQIGRMPE